MGQGRLLQLLAEHAQLALLAWALGVGAGGALGAALALALRRVFARAPWLRGAGDARAVALGVVQQAVALWSARARGAGAPA